MKDIQILRVFILGVIAIIGIIALQTYWVVNTWNNNEEEFNLKVTSSLYRVARSLADYNSVSLPPRNLIKKRSANYYIVNTEFEIDPSVLEFFLQRELESMALNIDFEYAVFDCSTRQMVYGDYCSYSPNSKRDLKLGIFPTDHEFTYYFGVRFPTRANFLFGKMQLSAILSGILFITVLFFTYSLFVILRQKRLTEMQKDFINNMTHEFKTPLSTIQIAADVFLNNTQVKADQRLFQYAGIIREQNSRLNAQVERVLQVARFEQNHFLLSKEPLDLGDLIRTVVVSESVRVQEKGGAIEMELSAVPIVWADRFHLTNLLHSLIDNAAKYCRDKPEITINLGVSGNEVHLSIADNGIGIAKEHQAKVFEKFYRVPTGNVHNVKGFGLGLYYVRRVCTAHGYKIHLLSEIGTGSMFLIKIPLELIR
jgi:two-component system phosphate regulon sensor histidine kinase PhoR